MVTSIMLDLIRQGGWTMLPLLICSVIAWIVIFERTMRFRKLNVSLKEFHLEAMNLLLRNDLSQVKELCRKNESLPTAELLQTAIERRYASDPKMQKNWVEALERKRQLVNQDVKRNLWVLGTIGSASPFIGLAGTVIGILHAFGQMAKEGAGGFAVVAAGISEALIATAAGIVVAVVAVMAYNIFQTRAAKFILLIKIQAEEFAELIADDGTKV